MPEPRRPHVQERIEAESAKVIERVRRGFHPFYNGRFGAARRVGKLPDCPFDHGPVRSAANAVDPVGALNEGMSQGMPLSGLGFRITRYRDRRRHHRGTQPRPPRPTRSIVADGRCSSPASLVQIPWP